MNLVIDIGNFRSKIAVFENDELVELEALEGAPVEAVKRFVTQYKPSHSILSSVVINDEGIIRLLNQSTQFTVLSAKTPVPPVNKYGTPETLGTDRLAAICGAYTILPHKNVLVINGGTCITFDFLSEMGEYLGGAISPGVNMRFSALNTFTDKLPLINFDAHFDKTIGTSTREAILSGVQNGIIAELEGTVDRYKKQFESLAVVLCGGDSKFFESHLKNSIFAPMVHWQPNLVLIGLNAILKYQYA